jgi:two-component system chemotaxis response regulator CheY
MTLPTSIMIVEDDDDIREMLRLVLECSGYRVATARDGLEAWDSLAQGERPVLIILDLMMPRMDGEQFLKKLRASSGSSISVVVMSGHPGAIQTARDLKADASLIKPVELEDLLDTIERFVPGTAAPH